MQYLTHYQTFTATAKEDLPYNFLSELDWNEPSFKNSEKSIFKDYGIERDILVAKLGFERTYNKANSLRTLLDILEDGIAPLSRFRSLTETICKESTLQAEFFDKVLLLSESPRWNEIAKEMVEVFSVKWISHIAHSDILLKSARDAVFSHTHAEKLTEEQMQLAKQFIQYSEKIGCHDFIINGTLALYLNYDFPIFPGKVEIAAKNSRNNVKVIEDFCKEIDYTLEYENSAKPISNQHLFIAYDFDFSTENKVMNVRHKELLIPTYLRNDNSKLLKAFSAKKKKSKPSNTLKTFELEVFYVTLLEEIKKKVFDLEKFALLCYLYNHHKKEAEKIKNSRKLLMRAFRGYGIRHFAYAFRTQTHSLIDTNQTIKEFIDIYTDETYLTKSKLSWNSYEMLEIKLLF